MNTTSLTTSSTPLTAEATPPAVRVDADGRVTVDVCAGCTVEYESIEHYQRTARQAGEWWARWWWHTDGGAGK